MGWNDLPVECKLEIISFLSVKEIFDLREVSSEMNSLIETQLNKQSKMKKVGYICFKHARSDNVYLSFHTEDIRKVRNQENRRFNDSTYHICKYCNTSGCNHTEYNTNYVKTNISSLNNVMKVFEVQYGIIFNRMNYVKKKANLFFIKKESDKNIRCMNIISTFFKTKFHPFDNTLSPFHSEVHIIRHSEFGTIRLSSVMYYAIFAEEMRVDQIFTVLPLALYNPRQEIFLEKEEINE